MTQPGQIIMKCKRCGHETDEGTLDLREFCKGCGLSLSDFEGDWDKFEDAFDWDFAE